MFATPYEAPPRVVAKDHIEGCFLSSLDLRSGLDIRVLSAAALPPEVWRELQRLQASWGQPAPRTASSAAAPSV